MCIAVRYDVHDSDFEGVRWDEATSANESVAGLLRKGSKETTFMTNVEAVVQCGIGDGCESADTLTTTGLDGKKKRAKLCKYI